MVYPSMMTTKHASPYPHQKSLAPPPHLQKDYCTSTRSSKTGTPSTPPLHELHHTSTPLQTVRPHHPTINARRIPHHHHHHHQNRQCRDENRPHINSLNSLNPTRTTPKNPRSLISISSPRRTRARSRVRGTCTPSRRIPVRSGVAGACSCLLAAPDFRV
jgi:hypothetical protein